MELQLSENYFNNPLFTFAYDLFSRTWDKCDVARTLSLWISFAIFAWKRACQFSLFLSKDESWSHPVAEKMREFLNLLFFSRPLAPSKYVYMRQPFRFSRSKVARLSVGRGILDWQQIRGVKRIALKCRKERGTMRLGSLFGSARILSIVELQLTAETFLRCGYSSDISTPYFQTNIARIYISCNATFATNRRKNSAIYFEHTIGLKYIYMYTPAISLLRFTSVKILYVYM